MKRYEFTQNNTGGSFITNNSICHRIFIEANDEAEAITIAERLGCYWDGCSDGIDCNCCGDRWSNSYIEGIDFPYKYGQENTFENIIDYVQYLANTYLQTSPDARIFYNDGYIKEIFKQ